MLDQLMHPLPGAPWVIVLACVRVMSVVGAMLALGTVRRFWRARPLPNTLLLIGLLGLGLGQVVGALGMDRPTAPIPTGFAFLVNGSITVVCLGIYVYGIVRDRREEP